METLLLVITKIEILETENYLIRWLYSMLTQKECPKQIISKLLSTLQTFFSLFFYCL